MFETKQHFGFLKWCSCVNDLLDQFIFTQIVVNHFATQFKFIYTVWPEVTSYGVFRILKCR